jgi:hypothetical protein
MNTQLFRRTDFTGITDRYGMLRQSVEKVDEQVSQNSDLDNAVAGNFPLNVGGILSNEIARTRHSAFLVKARHYAKFYEGKQYDSSFEEGKKKRVFNYSKAIIDKSVSWLCGKGWKIECRKGSEALAERVNEVWKANNSDVLLRQLGIIGGVTGNAYIIVTIVTHDQKGKPLRKNDWRILVNTIDSRFVFPIFSSNDPQRPLRQVLIQYPETGVSPAGKPYRLYSVVISEDSFQEFYDAEPTEPKPNQFNRINVVHIPNQLSLDSPYGLSDLENVAEVNIAYNEVTNKIDSIIDYHADPVTCVYGARVSSLEKGANRVWSNIPVEGRVENLELDSDLKATFEYRKQIKEELSQLSEVPEVAFDSKNFSLTNTSGLAMQMMFQPLIEKTIRKQSLYGRGLCEASGLIVDALKLIGEPVEELAEAKEVVASREFSVSFVSILPRDEQAELDRALKKRELGVWSHAELIRRLGDVQDNRRLLIELAADRISELTTKLEVTRTINGEKPNLVTSLTSSAYLMDDMGDLIEFVASLDAESKDRLKKSLDITPTKE